SDSTFLEKMNKILGKHMYYKKPKRSQTAFSIVHYAAEVTYDVVGFLDKNRDNLQEEICMWIQDSKCPFVRKLVPWEESSKDSSAKKKQVKSVSLHFKVGQNFVFLCDHL